ncbi:hypothetical protein Q1695_011092 [Nippostrongylus brasiliensis]|nr:hypothetical protein Q1695_011092 [Nippostrongylus brasiliensis]
MKYPDKLPGALASVRNMVSFWIFGLCNNFAFSVMLAAAQDILNKQEHDSHFSHNVSDLCVSNITYRICSPTSAGVVLLCNVLPALFVKLMCPFVIHRVPYGIRHFVICTLQATSLLVTAFAETVPAALFGVCVASLAGGFGETTYLGLAGHYSQNTIVTWSSGTGMAGLAGAFCYAGMTDSRLLALSPSEAMLMMLVIPALFAFTYYVVLVRAPTVRKVSIVRPTEWFVYSQPEKEAQPKDVEAASIGSTGRGIIERLKVIKSLLPYMVPMFFVYLAEYLINQGLLELTIFDCSHGYGTSPASQYRWYQVMYQTGVFISRSSLNLVQFNMTFIALMPVLQVSCPFSMEILSKQI